MDAVHNIIVYRLICHNVVVFVCVQFLLIYRKAYDGSLPLDCGLNELARLTEINVDEVGVIGAKEFFEAKVLNDDQFAYTINAFGYKLFIIAVRCRYCAKTRSGRVRRSSIKA